MRTSDFDYILPEKHIAQEPWPIRDECKLLTLDRHTGTLHDGIFSDIYDLVNPGDLLVANETRVMPARLFGTKRTTGGVAEVFLLREVFDKGASSNTSGYWEALVRPGKRLKQGAVIEFSDSSGSIALVAEIVGFIEGDTKGHRLVHITTDAFSSLDEALHQVGNTPLPPYIKDYRGDKEMYQTVFAKDEKSAAAPTAGLHFTPELIERIKKKGAFFETVELEVGLDTFRIVEEDDPRNHHIHTEKYSVTEQVVNAVAETKSQGGRVIAVGTTSVRSLESAWCKTTGCLVPRNQEATSLYLLPGSPFHVVDSLITNFHVPRSTLMMLVSAFSTPEYIRAAYQHALKHDYRFLSFGDAMFIKG